ncbi:putative mitochondrial iron uptake protein [Erysiphe necator]|uniref:ferroxidase n=1 Tax=Uncinula necator TaxID=52586 RepID=A0A0B1NZS7_UNCNE|nr:putative mitochondrial iron uptake protein [Erysiphe necator]
MSRSRICLPRYLNATKSKNNVFFLSTKSKIRQTTVANCYYKDYPLLFRPFTCKPEHDRDNLQKSHELNNQSSQTITRANSVTPANLSVEQYHALADTYLSDLEEKFNELQDKDELIDVEFSAGVLTLTLPPKGTYVLNKQPPNKQIWLASPISGPKRYDYVHFAKDDKHGAASGEWVYLRDGSTLSNLLMEECQINMKN